MQNNHGLLILTLELWKETKQWHKKYEKYHFCTERTLSSDTSFGKRADGVL